MSGWVKSDSRHGISIQRGTENVPNDGMFHVVVDGGIVLSTKVEAAALAEFEDRREGLKTHGRELLRREKEVSDFNDHRRGAWAQKSARDARKGGRGIGRR